MKLKGIVLAVILLLASIMMPFNVYADTISNSNVNINYYLDSVTETTSGTFMQTYRVEFVFDQSYLGWISTKMVGTYISNNTVPITTSQFTKTQAIYVNGSIAETSFTIVTPNTQNGGALQSLSQSIQNSNVTPLADLSTLDDILNVLTDINNNIEIDVLEELQNIVSNTSLSNTYLEKISLLRQYDFPIESLSFILSTYFYNTQIIDLFENGYYVYPIIHVPAGNRILRRYIYASEMDDNLIMIFGGNVDPSLSVMRSLFTISNGQIVDSELISSSNIYKIVKLSIQYTGASAGNMNINVTSDLDITPIYFNSQSYSYLTTDFALLYGLSNTLLDNIKIIAQGTNQSNSAASDLESSNSQMADDMDDLATIESGYNQQFNNQLQSIDFTSPIQNNAGILPAANFVITIFNGLINNNPFSVLIIIVCILLIGKKVIGK